MFPSKSFVLLFCLLRTEGKGLRLRKSKVEVNEFQPLTLICELVGPYPVRAIDWINNGENEFSMGSYCPPGIHSTKDYSKSCLSNKQYNLTINNVTRRNHGDIWYCRENIHMFAKSNDVEVQVKVPISNISLFTENQIVTVSENESAVVQCVCHGGIPAGQITWFYDKGTPDDASDDVILTEMNNETITQTDKTITTKSYVALKAITALIGTSLYCKATNDNVNWLVSKGTNIAILLLPAYVEVTHPPIDFLTVTEDKIVYFECVTSPGYPASYITWYKVTNGSEVIISADGSSTTEMNDRTFVTRSWVSLNFSISDDWTLVYCTANNSAGTLMSRNRAAVHVHKITENMKMNNNNGDSTLAKAAIGLSSITGTVLVFFIVGCLIFMKLRSPKAYQREHAHDSGHVNQANDQGKDNTCSGINLKASAGNISYTTLEMYENTTFREPYEPMQMEGDS